MPDTMQSLRTSHDLDPLLERIGDAKYVFLGEASHGTHEFYTWRTAITKRLIQEKGFNFIAVEGDWPDCYLMNRYVKGYSYPDKKSQELLHQFERWPTWMWANWEIASLMDWLKEHNSRLQNEEKVGFYGLDVYSLWESMDSIVAYLEENDPVASNLAKKALKCFEPYGGDEYKYARAQYSGSSCREPLVKLLSEIRRRSYQYDHDAEAALNAEQNAQIAVNAENYYSNMMRFDDNSWNIRDKHMMETLNRLLDFHGSGSKSIVWAHNTHIGDARYTDMKDSGLFNIGQLAREEKGRKDVVLVGFGSYSGTVIAGRRWGAPMEVMNVPAALNISIEAMLHNISPENKLVIFGDHKGASRYGDTVPHRAIGVVYNPEKERRGNYVPTELNERYDAFIYIDISSALHPLHLHPESNKIPETYPFNF